MLSALRVQQQQHAVAHSTLQYSIQGNHSFYNSDNNINTFNIDSSGNVSCTGNVVCSGNLGVRTAAINGFNLAIEKYVRIDGTATNNPTKALSIGGYGLFEMDAPGVAGGRFKIDNGGNVTCKGTITASNSVITNSINNSLISYFHPTPYNDGRTSTNQTNSSINLCCATTAGNAHVFPYLSVICSDIANSFGTKVFLSSEGQYWTGYNFNSRIIVDSSFATNSGLASGGTINFQTSNTNDVSVNTFQNICIMDTNNVRMFKSPRTINCNYENEGQLISFQTLASTAMGNSTAGHIISSTLGGVVGRAAGRAAANRLRNRNIENQESQPLLTSSSGERLGGRRNRNRLIDNEIQPEQPSSNLLNRTAQTLRNTAQNISDRVNNIR
jgi:hypothetical protein